VIDPALAPLAALAVLQVKHLVCDYYLQTTRQTENKGIYGHPDGLVHSGIHVAGTAFVFAVYPTPLLAALAILFGEFVVHYHIDWLKSVIGRRFGWTTRDRQYWWALGTDQFAHQATYLVIVLILVLMQR
jgi:hypothetical protein